MEEIWKTLVFEGIITNKMVSNKGRVVREDGTECKLCDNGAGYLSVLVLNYKKDGKRINGREYIHRLVAQYFLPNPHNLPQVNHIDCDKSNNNVENLEWVTRKANIDHAHASGRMKKRTENGAVTHLTIDEVIECYTRVKKNKEGLSAVARDMGKPRTTISSIMNKRSRSDITDKLDKEFNGAS